MVVPFFGVSHLCLRLVSPVSPFGWCLWLAVHFDQVVVFSLCHYLVQVPEVLVSVTISVFCP